MLKTTALLQYLSERVLEFDQIDEDRKNDLRKISNYISDKLRSHKTAQLIVICTHNSRRSQMAQIWLKIAAAYSNLSNVETFSGGTESTAFYTSAVEAMIRAGVNIEMIESGKNPVYQYSIALKKKGDRLFSKKYEHADNPQKDFAAIMVCSDAEKNCPIVYGAEERFSVPYNDPKAFDGLPEEAEAYSERCCQIAREMLYIAKSVKV